MKVLIVEDNAALTTIITTYLGRSGFVCEQVTDLNQALEKLYGFSYDIVLLDLTLPDGDGLTLLEQLKSKWSATGVLIMSAKNALDDRLKGLDMGADDYLSKPFHMAELNSRLKAIYRRRHQKGAVNLIFKEIMIQVEAKEVELNNIVLDLTKKEFELLRYFMVNKNRLLTKQAIAEHLWGDYMDMVDSFDFVYQHIKNLRKKIKDAGGQDYISTVYGGGYKMMES
jgi:DNA-binding response OmpR family regulator